MENLDVMVLRTLLAWRQAGQRALLATVVRTDQVVFNATAGYRAHHRPMPVS